MKRNMGQTDRLIRLVLGLAIAAFGLVSGNWLGLIGVVLLATAALGWCPLYVPFGFSTRKG